MITSDYQYDNRNMELFIKMKEPCVTFDLYSTEGRPTAGASLLGEGVHEPQHDPICASQHPAGGSASECEGVHFTDPAHVEASLQDTGASAGRLTLLAGGDIWCVVWWVNLVEVIPQNDEGWFWKLFCTGCYY